MLVDARLIAPEPHDLLSTVETSKKDRIRQTDKHNKGERDMIACRLRRQEEEEEEVEAESLGVKWLNPYQRRGGEN